MSMEFQQSSSQFQEDRELLFSTKAGYYALLGLSLLTLLAFLLFGTISTDLTCVRSSSSSVECSLVRNTPLLKMSALKILEPLAADVTEHRTKATTSYNVEIRAAHISYTLTLLSAFDYKVAQNAANEVNTFLHSSNESLFSKRFPGKQTG